MLPLKSFLYLGLLPSLILAQGATICYPTSDPPCLGSAEAYLISLRWLQIFQTNENGTGTGSALVASTLSDNFTVSYTALKCLWNESC